MSTAEQPTVVGTSQTEPPPAAAAPLEREVERISHGDWLLYVRAARWALDQDMNIPFICKDDRCEAQPICEKVDLEGGGLIIRCGHKDRVYVPPASGPKSAFVRRQERRAAQNAARLVREALAVPADPAPTQVQISESGVAGDAELTFRPSTCPECGAAAGAPTPDCPICSTPANDQPEVL